MQLPIRDGVQILRNPTNEKSSFIVSFAGTRPSDIYRALALEFAQRNRYPITPALLREIERIAQERDRDFYAEVRARGIAKPLRDLLSAKRKKHVERIASEIVINVADFIDLIHNCQMLGLSHHPKFLSFEPEQRALTDDEREALFSPSDDESQLAAKARSKVQQFFVEREHRAIHMFANASDEWHCFFSSFDDTLLGDDNHWTGGAHLHFVNHVFDPRNLTKKKVWKALDEKRQKLPKVHIRFRDPRDTSDRPEGLLYADPRTARIAEVPPRE